MPRRDRTRLEQLVETHSPDAVRKRLAQPAKHNYLKDFVYGGIDGAVTTFAVVSGVAGADLSSGIVIILGLANLVGDGFSMAAGNFLGTRAEQQLRERLRRIEEEQIAEFPQGEVEEVRQLMKNKGFSGPHLEESVRIVTSDQERWIEMMLAEEYGLPTNAASPWRAAGTTFAAFIAIGLLPLSTFLLSHLTLWIVQEPFFWSAVTTAFAFAAVGAIKSKFVDQAWYWSALETLFVGGLAAGLAFSVGWALRGIGG